MTKTAGEAHMINIGHIQKDDVTTIPTFRAAYSDRTALLMAKVARRAYEPFAGGAREALERDDVTLQRFFESFSEIGLADCTAMVDRVTETAGFIAAGDD